MMPGELQIEHRPELERPVLIAAFRGWNDGAQGASLAGGYLAKTWDAQQFASIDPEDFYDFQATRPMVSLVEGITRRIDWPDNDFYHASPEGLGRDALLLLGVEPNLRWRRFTSLIVELAREHKVELVVTLGALLADVPHTRPAPVTGTASDTELVERLGLQASRYEGPTGIVGVLHDACSEASLPSVSLWAAVPHYVSLRAQPAGRARALRAARRPARGRDRHVRARAGGRGLHAASHRGRLHGRGHRRVRPGARAPRRDDGRERPSDR